MRMQRLWFPLAVATAALGFAAGSSARAGNTNWKQLYETGLISGAYGAGDAIGAAAVGGQGGYDGGRPVGNGSGSGPADRSCFTRRPVYDENGTMIGTRGRQIC